MYVLTEILFRSSSPLEPSVTVFVLQLGNYLGAIQNWVTLQRTLENAPSDGADSVSKILYSIVGLHAITMPQDPKVLKRERRESLACLLACGVGPGGSIDPTRRRATLFFQEEVSADTQRPEIAPELDLINAFFRFRNTPNLHGISTR
jgi:tryptophanyl-tRNA synthetase